MCGPGDIDLMHVALLLLLAAEVSAAHIFPSRKRHIAAIPLELTDAVMVATAFVVAL